MSLAPLYFVGCMLAVVMVRISIGGRHSVALNFLAALFWPVTAIAVILTAIERWLEERDERD